MSLTEDELILRVRAMGFSEAEAQAAALRREVAGVGDASMAAGERSRVGFGLLSRGIGGLAAAVGITGAIVGVKDLIHQGMSLQMQQGQLRAALQQMGVTGEAAYQRVDNAAISMAEHGGFTRPEQLTVMTRFIAQTHSLTDATLANKAAVDLARGAQIPWQAAQMAIGRALAGNTTRLAQYINFIPQAKNAEAALTAEHARELVQLRERYSTYGKLGQVQLRLAEIQLRQTWATQQGAQVTDKTITSHQVLQAIFSKYGHATDAFNNSIQGMASNLKNSFQIMISETGKSLLPVVKDVLKVFTGLFKFLSANRWILVAVASAIGLVAGAAGLRLMYSGLRMVTGAAKDTVTGLFGFRTRLLQAREAAELATQKERMLVTAIQQLGKDSPETANALMGMSRAEIEAAASVEKMNGQVESQIALAAKWQQRMTTAGVAAETSMTGAAGATQLATVAEGEATGATGLLAGAVDMLSAALDMIPFMVVFTAIGLGLNLLMTHWKSVSRALVDGWKWVEHAATTVWHTITHVATAAFHEMIKVAKWAFNSTPLGVLPHLLGGLGGAVGNLIHGNIGGAASSLMHAAGGALHAATFGLLGGGGPVRAKHYAFGGPVGADTVPGWLTPGEYVLNSAVAQQIGTPTLNAWTGGGYGAAPQIMIQPGPVVLNIDGRTLARGVVRYTIERAARGPSGLVGGSIVTGAGGPTSPGD